MQWRRSGNRWGQPLPFFVTVKNGNYRLWSWFPAMLFG